MIQTSTQRIAGTLRLSKHRHAQHAANAHAPLDVPQSKVPDQPALPHEADEHGGMTGGVPSPIVEQAARDLKHGIKDTSRATEANVAYEKLKTN